MKCRNKITAVISAILLMTVAAGCKHSALGTLEDIETRKPEVEVYTKVKGIIENYAEIIHETVTANNKKPARTIAPDIVKSGYKFFIYGEMGNSFTGPFEITDDMIGGDINAEKKGTFEVTLKKGEWNLTLVAFGAEEFEGPVTDGKYSKSPFDGKNALPTREECKIGFADKAMLMAKAYVDLSKGDTSDVTFNLSPEGLSKKGDVHFFMVLDGWTLPKELKYTGDDKNLTVTGSIKDLKTNTVVEGTEKELTVSVVADDAGVETVDKVLILKDTQYIEYNLGDTKLDPGTYSFILEFENTSTKIKWTWNDRIMIFPGDKTDETQYLQEIIMKSPKAPEWLYASAVTTSTSPYIPKTNAFDASDDYYQVVFQWADWALENDKPEDICNETHFELQIGDITGIKADDVDFTNKNKTEILFKHTEATESDPEKYETYFTDSGDQSQTYPVMIFDQSYPSKKPYYVDGSMLANNQKLTVNLKLGKQYVARIRAVNDTGASDWTYVELKNEDEPHFTTKVAIEKAHITLDGEYFKGSTINNYRVRYYLNGGESVKTGEGETWTWKGDFIDYYGPVKEDDNSIGLYFKDFYKDGKGLKNGDILLTGWKKRKEGSSSNASYYPVSEATEESAITYDKSSFKPISGYGEYKFKMEGTTTQDNGNGVVISRTRVYLTKTADANQDTTDGWEVLTTGPYSNVKITKESSDSMKLYTGYDNLPLWAQYPASFNWEIVTINELTPGLISYQVVQADGTAVPDEKKPTYINASGASEACPEYAAGTPAAGETPAVPAGTTLTVSANKSATATFHPSDAEGCDFHNIKWTLDASKVAYRYFRVTIKQSDGSDRTIDIQKDITISDDKFEVTTDVSDCRKGHYYNVLIEAGLPNSMLASTIPVVLYIK